MILLLDLRSLARLGFQLERGLKKVDIAAGGLIKRTQRFGGFHPGESALADKLPNDCSILLLHPGLIVLTIGPGTGKLNARSSTIVQNGFMDERAVVIRIETTERKGQSGAHSFDGFDNQMLIAGGQSEALGPAGGDVR